MRSLEQFAHRKLQRRSQDGLRRNLVSARPVSATQVDVKGQTMVSFASNDYLGLASDPRTAAAAQAAATVTGATASRLVVGNHDRYGELERRLAELKGTTCAVVFGSGVHVNLGVIPALMGPEDLIIIDDLGHACLYGGAQLSGAPVVRVPHNDVGAVADQLRTRRDRVRHVLVLTEGVFSMDGDLAPLPDLVDACERHDAWLLVDDAHATGVIGEGRGSAAAWRIDPERIPLQVGTLSKALGSYGGFLACSAAVADLMVNRARTLVYSTGLPPSVVAAASAAVEVVGAEPWRRDRVRAAAARVATALGQSPPAAAIVPWILGSAERALEAHRRLWERGFWVPAMRPPTVPEGKSRLRFSLSAAHSDDQLDRLLEALADVRRGLS
jgi:8-amino-7-oxononanoate synthase